MTRGVNAQGAKVGGRRCLVVARWLLGALAAMMVLWGSEATACPLCLSLPLSITSQELAYAERVVLVEPSADGTHFQVVAVIKGDAPPDGIIAERVFRADPAAPSGSRPLLLLRHPLWAWWVNFGAIDASYAGWLRQLAATSLSADMTDGEWREHLVFLRPYLESPEPMVAEIAHGDFARAPYGARYAVRAELDPAVIRGWLEDSALQTRHSLYALLLGIAGRPEDAAYLERRLDAAWKVNSATNLAALLAADLELRGPSRVAWVEQRYLLDRRRTVPEIEAALLALSVHGAANGAIPRARVIQAYRVFIKQRGTMAGLVVPDLAAWGPAVEAPGRDPDTRHPFK